MTFRATILSALRESAAVIAQVPANRIYFGQVLRGEAPFIGCFRISTQPTHSTDNGASSAARLDNIILQVTVYAITDLKTDLAAEAIRGALEATASISAFLTDQREAEEDATDLQGAILTFSCWFAGASPA